LVFKDGLLHINNRGCYENRTDPAQNIRKVIGMFTNNRMHCDLVNYYDEKGMLI